MSTKVKINAFSRAAALLEMDGEGVVFLDMSVETWHKVLQLAHNENDGKLLLRTIPNQSALEAINESIPKAAADVLAERCRQINTEGWTNQHDDSHICGSLAAAGACYAMSGAGLEDIAEQYWPWHEDWWKPTTPRRNLVKAAALILAEIERLDRSEQK